MSIEILVLLLLVVGFSAAPLANWSVRARRPRLAATVVLIAAISILACFGFALDRGNPTPQSWFGCGVFVLMGVGICVLVYRRQKFRAALVLAGAVVLSAAGLHFFAMDIVRTCQHACFRVHHGMDANQVRSVISAEFSKSPDYRVVEATGTFRAEGESFQLFQLRPLYAQLSPEIIQVSYVDGRAAKAWTSAVVSPMTPLFIFELVAGLVLCAICVNRLYPTPRKEAAVVEQISFDAVKGRFRAIQEGHHAGHGRDLWMKRTLMGCARHKIRQLAYFDSAYVPTTPPEAEEKS